MLWVSVMSQFIMWLLNLGIAYFRCRYYVDVVIIGSGLSDKVLPCWGVLNNPPVTLTQ